ncbi:MAG: leucine-rich repeat protein [Lachnospiraceae bacterium]|nr:leucine-rich repeat protein [Lachnospiraceae bacterium]
MKKRISRILGVMLAAGMIVTSLPVEAFAELYPEAEVLTNDLVTEDDIVAENDIICEDEVQEPEDGTQEALIPEISDPEDLTVEPVLITDSEVLGAEPAEGIGEKTLGADFYVSGGDYTYKGDMIETDSYKYKNIFSGIYNDVQVERHGGRFFTGEEIVSLTGKDDSGVTLNKITAGVLGETVEADTIAASGKKVNFEVNDIPAEFVLDKTATWNDDNGVTHTVELNDETLIRKLYAWEYAKDGTTGIYHRVSSQEITSEYYSLNDPEKDENDNYASVVSGNVVVDTSKLTAHKITSANVIAIVAYMYDASVNDSLFEGMWTYSDDRIFSTLEQIEYESKRYYDTTEDDYYSDKTPYYDTDIYLKDEMGSFSIAAYAAYRRDDKSQTLTLYDTANQPNYGLMNGFTYGWRSKAPEDYLLDEWRIPATWTDPLTGAVYNVALGESAWIISAVSGEKLYLGGRRYPILASGVVISYGVAFPDDCTQLLTTGHNQKEMMCVTSIKIEAGPQGQKVGNNITTMNSMFFGNIYGNMGHNVPVTRLTSLDVSALDTSNVTDMSHMFHAQWVAGSGPDVSGFVTSKVTDFSYMFYDAHIADPDVSHFNTSKAVDMAYMFGAAGVWTDFRVKPHAYAQGVFTAIDLSSFDFAKVESMAGMFINQRLLSSIKFPAKMDTSHVKDMSELFMSCSSLTLEGAQNLTLLDTSSVVDMFGMFGCFHWRNWGGGEKRVLAADYTGDMDKEYNRDCYLSHSDGQECENRGPAITSLDLAAFANFDTSKVKNMALMFDLPEAESVSFGNKFNTSKATDMNRMFNLPKAESLDVSCFNTASLTKATLMFDLDTCRSINLGNGFDLSQIRENGTEYMFTAPVLAELDLSHVNFGSNANAMCASTIAYFNLGYLESGCKELETLMLPANMPVFADPAFLPETMFDEDGDEYDAVYGGNAGELTLTRSSAPLKNVYGFYTDEEGSDKLISETTVYADDQSDGRNMVYLKIKMDPDVPAPAPSVAYTVVGYRDGNEVPGDYVVTTFEHSDGIEVYAYSGTLKYDSYAIITANVRRSDGEVFTISCKVRVEGSQSEELKLTDSDGNSFTCYTNSDGTNTVTIKELWDKGSDKSKTTLRIGQLTGSGKTYTVTRIGKDAFHYTRSNQFFNKYGTNAYFTDIVLDESVKVIGANAFDPNDTSSSSILTFSGPGVEEIGDHAFCDMVTMTTVSLPKVKRLGCGVFCNTTSITTLNLNKDIESWNNGILMDEFANDRELTEFTIPSCISELGYGGLPRTIKSVEIPSTVKKIGYGAFSWCSDLESITIPATVTEIGEGAFCNCDALASVTFATGGQLTKIGDRAFSECKELAQISFPDTVTSFGKEVLKMNSYYGTKLARVKLPKNIKEVPDGTFYDCISLNEVTMPENVVRIGEEAFRVVGTGEKTGLSSITIPDSVTQIGKGAFYGLPITKITFPAGITVIPETVCFDCDSLQSVTFKGAVTEIERQAFANCDTLPSISIPQSVNKLGFEAFGACENLTGEIVIPEGVTEIPDELFRATKITKISFPDGVTSIGRSAFEECKQLEEVRFPAELKTIGYNAFRECYKLDNVALPVGIKKIDLYAFLDAGKTAEGDVTAYLPDTIEYVGLLAFSGLGDGAGYIFYGGSEESARALKGGNDGNDGYSSITLYYNGWRYPVCNAGWHVADEGIQYLTFTLNNDTEKTVTTGEAYKGVITKVAGYGDDFYGFDAKGYRYEDTSVVIGTKLYSFDGYGRATQIAGYSAGKTGIVGDNGVLVYLKDGVVQKAADSERFADNVVTVDGEKYLLQSNGILGTGYYPDSSGYEDGTAEAGITGWYFDDDSAKLLWVKKTDQEGNDVYYGKNYTTLLSGSYPNEDGETVKYANGRSTFLTGLKITDEAGSEITRTTLYSGPDAGIAGKPETATLKLVTLPEGVTLDPVPSVEWSIINNNPKTKGKTVITEVSHTDSQITVKAGAPGRAKVRVKVSAGMANGASVTYTKDCLVIVEDTGKYPTSVTITGSTQKINVGETLQLTATILPADATAGTALTWASTNTGIAFVDNTGLVRGIANGSVTISATTENGARGTYDVAVGSALIPEPEPVEDEAYVTGMTLNKNAVTLYEGESFKLEPTVSPVNAKNKSVSYVSDDSGVAAVDEYGTVRAVAAGVDGEGNRCEATATVTVTATGAAAGTPVTKDCFVTVLPSEVTEKDDDDNPVTPPGGMTDAESGEANIWVAGLNKDSSYPYTGNAIKPAIHVYKGSRLLNEGTDYKLKYKNNVKVSKSAKVNVTKDSKRPQIVITMKGAYSGSETVYFDIVPAKISDLTADNDELSAQYKKGKKNQLKPGLMLNGTKVKNGKKDVAFKWYETDGEGNATATESDCITAGVYAVKIFAGTSGNFAGETGTGKQVATVTVYGQTLMSDVKIDGFKKKLAYKNGEEVKQAVKLIFKDKKVKRTLTEKTAENPAGDYTVTYVNNREIGTATVTWEAVKDGEGNYSGDFCGKVSKTFKITGKYTLAESAAGTVPGLAAGEFVVITDDSATYTGAAVKPEVTVYAKVIDNNGTAEVRKLTVGKDYTLKYKNNKAVAAADAKGKKNKDIAPQVIIKGKGNYVLKSGAGTVKRFAIKPVNLNDLVLTVSDKAYSKKANAYKKTTILFTDNDYRSVALKAGKDYTVTYSTSDGKTAPGEGQLVTVTIEGKNDAEGSRTGNCYGKVTDSYRITGKKKYKDIAKAKVAVNPNKKGKSQACTYTGNAIEPKRGGKPELKITMGGKELIPGTDYEILGYYNNVNKGKNAVVLIRGIGNLRGVRAVKFKISAAPVRTRWGGIAGLSE